MPGPSRITLLLCALSLLPLAPVTAQDEEEYISDQEEFAPDTEPAGEEAPASATPPVTTKKIYRSIGPDGSIVFSDVPTKGAEEVDLSQPTVLDAPPPPTFVYSREKEEPVDVYQMLAITSPANDEAVRENAGNVTVNVAMQPSLRPGDQVVLLLDGREVAAGAQATFMLENVDRGTHQLRAVVRARDGSILKNSQAITFHLLRHSALHRTPNVGGAPKPPKPSQGGKPPGKSGGN